jgi:hypothetical protein
VGNFGIMGSLAPKTGGVSAGTIDTLLGNEMLAWNRWLIGWLNDEQIACVSSFPGSIQLAPLTTASGVKAAVVELTPTSALVVESRQRVGYDAHLVQEGALVYTVDTQVDSGDGPVVVHGDYSGDWADSSVLLQPGETVTVEGYAVSVITTSAEGTLINITVP